MSMLITRCPKTTNLYWSQVCNFRYACSMEAAERVPLKEFWLLYLWSQNACSMEVPNQYYFKYLLWNFLQELNCEHTHFSSCRQLAFMILNRILSVYVWNAAFELSEVSIRLHKGNSGRYSCRGNNIFANSIRNYLIVVIWYG